MPGSAYFTHVELKSASSERARKELPKELKSKLIKLHHNQVICCDGSAVNTEVKKGVIQILETIVCSGLRSRLVCQLPTNELLLRFSRWQSHSKTLTFFFLF